MLHLGQTQQFSARLFTIYKKKDMQYGKLENGEVIYYQKPENVICEEPTLKGYKEVITVAGESSGITETETQIILTVSETVKTVNEKRAEAYAYDKRINYKELQLSVDEALKIAYSYNLEDRVDDAVELTSLILAAKNEIRTEIPEI